MAAKSITIVVLAPPGLASRILMHGPTIMHASPMLSPRSAMRVLSLSGTKSLWLSLVDDCQFRFDHAGLRFFFSFPSPTGNCRIKITTIQIAESYSALAFLASSKIPRALPVFTVWFTGLFFLFSPACHRLRVSVAGSHTGGIRAIAHKHGFVDGIDSITSMGSAMACVSHCPS